MTEPVHSGHFIKKTEYLWPISPHNVVQLFKAEICRLKVEVVYFVHWQYFVEQAISLLPSPPSLEEVSLEAWVPQFSLVPYSINHKIAGSLHIAMWAFTPIHPAIIVRTINSIGHPDRATQTPTRCSDRMVSNGRHAFWAFTNFALNGVAICNEIDVSIKIKTVIVSIEIILYM